MKYKVIVSDVAKSQLATHLAFLAKVDKSAAVKLKERLICSFRSLNEYPERFPFLDEELIPKNKYHKMFVNNWYLVLYQIKDTYVYVDYILDCRQDYAWLKN